MKTKKVKLICLLFICITIPAITDDHPIYGSTVKRIALLPFKINSAENLMFLKDGIYDMFTTRLTSEGQTETVSRKKVEEVMKAEAAAGSLNETAARRIGSSLKADFVLFGSMTVIGNNVSIDAKMVDVTGNKQILTFFDQSESLGAVITKIDRIAAEINRKMFDRTLSATKAAASPPRQIKKADINAHPEKILKEEAFINHDETMAAAGTNVKTGKPLTKIWKSASFTHLINGICVGDVDGDGKIETVTISPHAVLIFRSEGGTFRKIAEIKENTDKNLIGVDSADINKNGYAEIFISSLNAYYDAANSYVIEYDGKNFTKIINGSPWMYRVADTPARGKILIGQRQNKGKPYAGKINEMIWQNNAYIPSDEIKTPRNTSLLGFAIGDVLNNGQETAIAYKENDRIRIIDSSGKAVWDSPDRYGGSMLHNNLPRKEPGQVENRKYYPMRLVVWQNEAKNETEVIAVKNYEVTDMKLERRQYTKSHIEAFIWDGIGLGPHWETRNISGYIQDFIVGDFDNDGQDELIAALIIKEGRVVLTKPKSIIIAFELSESENPES